MFWDYSLYILYIVLGTVLINILFRLRTIHNLKLLAVSILPVAIFFMAWDIFAVYRGLWSFNLKHMLGLVFINQPVEEASFFIVVIFYYITIFELVKKVLGEKK
jgi:lycopene cyclase domain-containing protein